MPYKLILDNLCPFSLGIFVFICPPQFFVSGQFSNFTFSRSFSAKKIIFNLHGGYRQIGKPSRVNEDPRAQTHPGTS